MLLDCLCAENENSYPHQLWSKRIYHDIIYCNIDAGDHFASSLAHHSVNHLNQMCLLFLPHALGAIFIGPFGHHSQWLG